MIVLEEVLDNLLRYPMYILYPYPFHEDTVAARIHLLCGLALVVTGKCVLPFLLLFYRNLNNLFLGYKLLKYLGIFILKVLRSGTDS